MKHEEIPVFADDRPALCDDGLYQWALDAECALRAEHARLAYILAHGRYGITERGEAVVYLPGLVPAPAHIGGLLEAIDTAVKEQKE